MKVGAGCIVVRAWGVIGEVIWPVLASALFLCGCAVEPDKPVAPPTTGGDGEMSAMHGYAAFGTQCMSGFNTDPKAVKLELWSCPLNLPVVELAEPIQPLYFNADCKRKTLQVRSYDRTIDTSWELLPDGTFNITQDGLNAKLKSDGAGNSGCVTPILMNFWGKVDCGNATTDQAKIRFETVMWLGKKTAPSPAASPAPLPTSAANAAGEAPQCLLPSKCYFHAIAAVDQCR